MMKIQKFVFFAIMLFCVNLCAQNTVTLIFTGKDRNDRYVQLDRVSITNQTKRWQEIILYPDTIFVLGSTDIEDYSHPNHFKLYQNTPNPFNGATDFALQLDENEKVVIEIFDLNGKRVADYQGDLTIGTHLFRATLTSPQTYLLSAKIVDGTAYIKMINNSDGGKNEIKYVGEQISNSTHPLKNERGGTSYPFDNGDIMEYVGFATINGIEYESEHRVSSLLGSQYISLQFDADVYVPPVVVIDSIAYITTNSGIIFCNVTHNNTHSIMERGVCWSQNTMPTISDSYQAEGADMGNYSSTITSLDSGVTYYVRAYAINSAGVGYSEPQAFTTLHIPSVETVSIDNLVGNTTSNLTAEVSCAVTDAYGTSIVARGLYWDTIPFVTSSNHSISVGSGSGSYSATITDLLPHTTYYVRAYATNSVGTGYGDLLSFTTPDYPLVITDSVYDITSNSATVQFHVISCEGNALGSGVCWATHPNVTLSDTSAAFGNGLGNYQAHLPSLQPYTTYFVRAYSTNEVGTSYGDELSFTTDADVPFVQTIGVSEIGNVFATAAGSVISDNGSPIITRGVCWSSHSLPTVSDSIVTTNGTLGQYSLPLNNLEPGQHYYFRAFASNEIGIGYGNIVSFRTLNTEVVNGFDVSWSDSVTPYQQEVIRQILNNMIIVEGGNTTIGSTQQDNESPVHIAKINTFGIGKYEVTQKEWNAIVDMPEVSSQWSNAYGLGDTFPAYNFSHDQFRVFISRLCDLTGLSFRMPTESEWEYAARGGIYANNYLYSGSDDPTAVAWFSTNADGRAHIVGSKQPNILGIYDMSGNVWEWCSDWYGMYSPGTYSNPTGPTNGTTRVLRGGCWYFNEDYCRVFTRYPIAPSNSFITYGGRLGIDVLPRVSTSPIIDISATTANWGGRVSDEIAAEVVERGLCWGTHANTSINDDTIRLGNGTGPFDYSKIELQANTTYFVRAYAINHFGVSYGELQAFTTPADNTQEYINGITVNWANGVTANQQEVIRQILNEMIAIEGGRYAMTSTTHAVLNPFFIGKYEISQKEWVALMGTTPTNGGAQWTTNLGFGNNFPTYYVSYDDVLSFMQTLNAYTGIDFRLPTEAEWEYAARGDGLTQNHLYAGSNSINEVAWYANNTTAHEVGLLQGNEIGAYDMSGNLTEWCSDYYDTLTSGVFNNPTGPITGTTRVVRGGGYHSPASACSVFARVGVTPDTRSATIGFRVAISGTSHHCFNTPTLMDVDGNVYHTVQIGSQCWMKENLRTTKYSNSIGIPLGTDTSSAIAYRYCPNQDPSTVRTYGYLYNWQATTQGQSSDFNPSGVQGACPDGWHMPSEAEWILLKYYLVTNSEYSCSNNHTYIAKSLASDSGWSNSENLCAIGYDQSTNNATGFEALPSGKFANDTDTVGSNTYFWNCSEWRGAYCHSLHLNANNAIIDSCEGLKSEALSIRCVRNETEEITSPTININRVTEITAFSALCEGSIDYDGDALIVAYGVCWSTMQNPTILDSHTIHTINDCENGNYYNYFSNLMANTTYHVRAYAICNTNIVYSSQVYEFTTDSNCGTISDRDGNVYNTVAIGRQCWMAKNLRSTKFADGTPIVQGTGSSNDPRYYYSLGNSSSVSYGLLYNYAAVLNNSSPSINNPSGVQGVCPTGWHVPSVAEWEELKIYMNSQNRYLCSGMPNAIAKSLAGKVGWNTSTEICAVGNNPSDNNSSCFNAYPVGSANYSNSHMNYSSEGQWATFWCSSNRYYFFGYYDYSLRTDSPNSTYNAYSVRCIKD